MTSRRLLDAIFFDASIQLYEAAKAYYDYSAYSTTNDLHLPVFIKTALRNAVNNWRRAAYEARYKHNGGQTPMSSYNVKLSKGKKLMETGEFIVQSLEAKMEPMALAYPKSRLQYQTYSPRLEWFGCSLSSCFLDIAHQLIGRFKGDYGSEDGAIVSRLEGLLKPYPTFIEFEEAFKEGGIEILKQGWGLVKEVDKEVKQALLSPPQVPQPPFKTGGDDFVSTHCAHTVVNSGYNTNLGSGQQHNGDAELVMLQSGSGSDSGSARLCDMPVVLFQGSNWVNVGSYNTNTGSGRQGVHMSTPKASLQKE